MFYHQGEIGILSYSWYSNAQHFIKKWDNELFNGGINCLFMLNRRQLPEPLFNLNTQYLRIGEKNWGVIIPKNLRTENAPEK